MPTEVQHNLTINPEKSDLKKENIHVQHPARTKNGATTSCMIIMTRSASTMRKYHLIIRRNKLE